MSNILAFWRFAYELTEEEFASLDDEGLAAMTEALSEQEREELLQWLRSQEHTSTVQTTTDQIGYAQAVCRSQIPWGRH